MKKLLLLTICLGAALSAWAWKPLLVGHRGCNLGVENTIQAYQNGVDVYGYDGLECDVRVTIDGSYVISHDETTNRLGGNLTVADATLAQLMAEEYTQTRNGVTYTGRICTVSEYLDICVEKNVFPVIELKWTTGINNNDMSNFPGLAQLVIDKGLADKAIFLTSMKQSLQYIRTNYPDFKCQWLCNANWESNVEWCQQWGLNPSIEAGCFDIHTVKRFHLLGLQCAMWTADSKANYEKYGNMGVYMITTNSFNSADAIDFPDIDWDAVEDVLEPLALKCDTVFRNCRANGTMPEGFPSSLESESTFKQAQQGAIKDGIFYTNDYASSTLLTYDRTGRISNPYQGTNSQGICFDDAGNLILRCDGLSNAPNKMRAYKNGSTEPVEINFHLNHDGRVHFITASGDIFSEEGGYVYHYPNNQAYVDMVYIANGEFVETYSSGELSFAGSTAGIVYPIATDPWEFVYQVRNSGYNYYKGTDKGTYITGSSSTTPPARNTSCGGAYFVLAGHKLFIHASGTNYNGGFTVRDMSANCAPLLSVPVLGTGGYNANPSVGAWFKVEPIDDNHCYVYEYCQGNGYAQYQLYIGDPYVEPTPGKPGDANEDEKVDVNDVTTVINHILNKNPNPFNYDNANVNGDDKVDVLDVTLIINIILGIN
jgi:glycerophosphoryl diester phosphodiesterase